MSSEKLNLMKQNLKDQKYNYPHHPQKVKNITKNLYAIHCGH